MASDDRSVSPAPLHLVLGDEELLVERAVQDVVDAARAVDPEAELRRLRAAELTPADLAAALSPSLFAEARVIVLEAAHEAGKDARRGDPRPRRRPRPRASPWWSCTPAAPGTRRSRTRCARPGPQVARCEKITRAEERARLRPRRGAPGAAGRSRPTRSAC